MTVYPINPTRTKYEYKIRNHKCFSLDEVAEYINSTKGIIQGKFYRSKINEIKINGIKIKRKLIEQKGQMMKWTFFTVGKDGKSYFPKRTGSSQIELIDAWTLDIQEAVLWDKPEDLEPLANEFCNVCVISITQKDNR